MRRTVNIIIIIVGLMVLFCTTLCFIDYTRIMLGRGPMFTLEDYEWYENGKLLTEEHNGLGYRIVVCHGTFPMPVKMQWLYLGRYACFIDTNNNHTDYIIVDETEACDTALEEIARDTQFIYYLGCIQSHTIFLKYNNGKKISLRQALEDDKVDITDLINHGLTVHKEPH